MKLLPLEPFHKIALDLPFPLLLWLPGWTSVLPILELNLPKLEREFEIIIRYNVSVQNL